MVQQWVLIDLTVTEEEKDKLSGLGLLSATLFAHEVVIDNRNRFQAGMWATAPTTFD